VKIDLIHNNLRNGRTLDLTPEDDQDTELLRQFFADLKNHPYVEVIGHGPGDAPDIGQAVAKVFHWEK
jgi:hypothetical protein